MTLEFPEQLKLNVIDEPSSGSRVNTRKSLRPKRRINDVQVRDGARRGGEGTERALV